MTRSAIQWTDRVWNPVTGCSKVSEGCRFCYAEAVADRFWEHQYPAVQVQLPNGDGDGERARRFTDVQVHPDRLDAPLRWRNPSRIFVNSMSDLFHEDVPDEFIDRVFAVMALARKHTFLVLTKRPRRMREYLQVGTSLFGRINAAAREHGLIGPDRAIFPTQAHGMVKGPGWPLPNLQLLVSIEDQPTADERIPILLDTPAAVRGVSAEPLLGPIDFTGSDPHSSFLHECEGERGLDWVVVGGESGPHARPCDLAWVYDLKQQCSEAGTRFFFKQAGSWSGADQSRINHDALPFDDLKPDHERDGLVRIRWRDPKGADQSEWPEDLRVREIVER